MKPIDIISIKTHDNIYLKGHKKLSKGASPSGRARKQSPSKMYSSLINHLQYNRLLSQTFSRGKGLCPVKIITGHVRIRTRVRNPTCPMITFTGHKLHPFQQYSPLVTLHAYLFMTSMCMYVQFDVIFHVLVRQMEFKCLSLFFLFFLN